MSNIKDFSSINNQKDFTRIYKDGAKWFAKNCVIYYEHSEDRKFAVIASKKVGCAVVRNRTKRLMRAIFLRLYPDLISGYYIFVAKKGFSELCYLELERNIKWSLRKLGCLKV
ncbi:ribonuclease P protein component [Campylobacter sp. MG1]|uniref:ribonuclease P protein component n=1 Tax=Campylobacter sp. MG1 TaxID=2976332 RepID=UPI002D1E3B3B|nr:ribonuclease P protein component [Campylobacter sp. MG1]